MIRKSILVVLIVLCGSLYGRADTLTLQNETPNNQTSGGVLTYPYNFLLNGTTALQLMCDDFTDDVSNGEMWNVNTFTMTDILTRDTSNQMSATNTYFSGAQGYTGTAILQANGDGLDATQRAYADAAYIFLNAGLTTGSTNPADVYANEAVWELFGERNGSSWSTDPFGAADQTHIDALELAAQNFTSSLTVSQAETDFGSIRFYTAACSGTYPGTSDPNCGQGASNGLPQEYIGKVPEPTSLVLLGSGLLGLGIITRRKRSTISD